MVRKSSGSATGERHRSRSGSGRQQQQQQGRGQGHGRHAGKNAPPPGARAAANKIGVKKGGKPIGSYNVPNDSGDPDSLYKVSGILEMHPNGYGFLRDPNNDYTRILSDPFVPGNMIEKFGFREGLQMTAMIQPGKKEQGPRVREVLDVEGIAPEEYSKVPLFENRTPINPESWLRLETGREPLSTRVIDLLTPLGKGQRALIVAPPRSGKTILLHHISQAVVENHPDVKVVVLLIDERPEEVTDFRRAVNAEVVASSLDREIESHVRLAQLVIERCRRLAEMGKDVFLLLDSITRLARAFNKWVGNTGRTMTGGVDIKAMDIPKKLFATARMFEGGGSLTIVGTALIETGSRMDDLIFQEFKGTGNMELVLDRRLAERRVYPAIDIGQSGTRREEKLLPPEVLNASIYLRRTLSTINPVDAMEQLTKQLDKYQTNYEFIKLINGAQRRFD